MLYKSLSLIGLYPVCFVCWTSLTVDLFMCSVMLDCEFIFGKALFVGILWRVYPSCMSSYLFIHTYCFSIEFLTWEIWDQVVEKWTPNLCKWRLMIRILRGDYFLSYPEPRQRGKLSCSFSRTVGELSLGPFFQGRHCNLKPQLMQWSHFQSAVLHSFKALFLIDVY